MIQQESDKGINTLNPHIVYLITLLDSTVRINDTKKHAYLYLGIKANAWIENNKILTTHKTKYPVEYFTSSRSELPSHLKNGKKRVIELIAECSSYREAREIEITLLRHFKLRDDFWEKFINQNCGDGAFEGLSDKARKKLSDDLIEYWKNPTLRKLQSERMNKYYENTDAREKRSEAMKKYCADPEVREVRSNAKIELYKDPKERKKQSDRAKAYYKRVKQNKGLIDEEEK